MLDIITYVVSIFIVIGIGFVAINIISVGGLYLPRYPFRNMSKKILMVTNGFGLQLAFIVAIQSTLGSLFYSEIAGYYPCPLCWYQRIAMYPLAIVLGVALWKSDYSVSKYVIPISVIGLLLSCYHYAMQYIPNFFYDSCSGGFSCQYKWISIFGFISIPLMALTSFAIILICMSVIHINKLDVFNND